ncbi:MAG: SDR family oxidoreductase [Chloroflexi bacterium]|nr:SDR family oxidoreductase [Chloroflexota bacterium]MBT4514803.1 SDR family oxidoreductase [Chloroflexota bacterium]MBT5319384.1 SDR family oxidoreductase [Chloroflexota bacterium]MBT6682898.1 SDR family oxidoreductase [Chloroflexota bacterium]
MDLSGHVAIVTGGATGIGRAIGMKMAEVGADIIVSDIDSDACQRTASEFAALGVRSAGIPANVTDPDAVGRMVAESIGQFGKIDVLVNNAGVAGAPGWYDHAVSREEDWSFTFGVNVKGMAIVTEAVLPHMKEAHAGKIVNLASVAGRQGRPTLPHYSATKAAVINYTQSLANELGRDNINVNAVCPGLLWTPMWGEVGAKYAVNDPTYEGLSAREVFDKMIENIIPLGREQTPEDIGDAIVFLVSDDAKNITGQSLNVDGGAFLN